MVCYMRRIRWVTVIRIGFNGMEWDAIGRSVVRMEGLSYGGAVE